MPHPQPPPHPILAWISAGLLALSANPASAAKWAAIEKSDLAVAKAATDPDADAEALFWEIRVVDELTTAGIHSDVTNHLRIKVFTDRGAESHGRVDIPYDAGVSLVDLAARVIRPDGSIVEIKKDAIFDRTILKGNGRKVKARSFAAPDLKPGGMLEYRWTQRRYDQVANYLRVPLQLEVPVRSITMWVKPLFVPELRYQFRVRAFNVATPHFEDGGGGFRRTVFPNVPAFREEPRMPPENAVRPWLLLSYEWPGAGTVESSWDKFAKASTAASEDFWRVDDSVRERAREIVGTEVSENAKLARLYDYCRTQIRDVSDDVHGMTEEDRRKVKPSKNPAETLRRGMGTSLDVVYLFAALARAAGFTTRIALLPDRSKDFFDPRNMTPLMLTETCAAVWGGLGWRFFDPAARYTPPGSLPWWEEGVQALLLDRDKAKFVPTPMAPPEHSSGTRRGVFTLAADGTLEGDVRNQYTGHWGAAWKSDHDESSDAERAASITKSLQSHLSGAEISTVRVEHAADPESVYTVSYHVRMPAYGTRAGRRLILDPSYFAHGVDQEFSGSRRTHAVYFSYPWVEDDSIAIQLPEGAELEALPTTEPYDIPGIARHSTQVATSMDGRTLVYRRHFEFGRGGTIYFPNEEYPRLKRAFDSFEERNHQALVLTVPVSP